jgi:hypothetical protein
VVSVDVDELVERGQSSVTDILTKVEGVSRRCLWKTRRESLSSAVRSSPPPIRLTVERHCIFIIIIQVAAQN